MKHILFLLFLITNIFANQFNTDENSIFSTNILQKTLPDTLPQDYQTTQITNVIKTKNAHLQYTHYPKKVYEKQKFSVTLKAIISLDNLSQIKTLFEEHTGVEILNPQNEWLVSDDDEHIYTNSFEFIATQDNFEMPIIKIDLYENNTYKDSAKILPKPLEFKKIVVAAKKFSNILADDLVILGQKTKQYDNNNLLTIMEIEASNSNLDEFYLEGYEKQGLESFSSTALKQKIFYYVITPVFVKDIQFNYYNTKLKRSILVKAVVVLKEDLVSTQTDLNPNNSGFLFFKKIALGVSIVLLLVLLYFKRSILLFILIILLGGYFTKLVMPNKKINIAQNTHIYILPTKNSTIFHITEKPHRVEILAQKVDFSKVLFENQAIGWVRNENLHK